MMEALPFSETSLLTRATPRHIPEDYILQRTVYLLFCKVRGLLLLLAPINSLLSLSDNCDSKNT
jgi:hypothetical protein